MTGGAKEPCLPRSHLIQIQKGRDGAATVEGGKLCPRVVLRRENRRAGAVAAWIIRTGGEGPVLDHALDAELAGLTPRQRQRAIAFAWEALSDDAISFRIREIRRREIEEAKKRS